MDSHAKFAGGITQGLYVKSNEAHAVRVFRGILKTKAQSNMVTGVNKGPITFYVKQDGSVIEVPRETLRVLPHESTWLARPLTLNFLMRRDEKGFVELNGRAHLLPGKPAEHFSQGFDFPGTMEELLSRARTAEGLSVETTFCPLGIRHYVSATLSLAEEVTDPIEIAQIMRANPPASSAV